MVRYKGRRVSRSIGILPSSKNSNTFIIHEYDHWVKPYEKSFEWLLMKGFYSYPVFVGNGFGNNGMLHNPLANAGKLHDALTLMNKQGTIKQNGMSLVIHAYRSTDWNNYWIEKHKDDHGNNVYYIYDYPEDGEPVEVLNEFEFMLDYVITRPETTVTV